MGGSEISDRYLDLRINVIYCIFPNNFINTLSKGLPKEDQSYLENFKSPLKTFIEFIDF